MQKRARDYGVNKSAKGRAKRQNTGPAFVKRVQAVIQRSAETKVCDTYLSPGGFFNSSPIVNDLCQIAQGTNDINRVGSKIKPVGIVLRYNIITQTGQTAPIPVRCVIVQDFRQTSSTPAVTDYLKDVNGASGISTAYLMPKNFENSPNFRIIFDETKQLGPDLASNGQLSGHKNIISSKAFKDVNFKGTTAALNENSSGRIFILFMTTQGASAQPIITYHARLYFKDY